MSIRFDGSPRAVHARVIEWLAATDPEPLEIHTSGSTGEPKRVLVSRAAVLASAKASLDRIGGPGRWLAALPTNGIGGLQVLVRSAVAGIEPVFLDEHDGPVAALEELVSAGGRTYASFVPTQLARLIADHADRLARLDAILVGGAAMPAALRERADAAGIPIVRTYGMSETAGGCVYDGVPLDGVRVRIRDGVIELFGPVLFDGYVGAPRTDDWFTTSDLGRINADGRLEVWGRADDVAISGGVNVPLGAVERALGAIESVREVAVVGVPDDEWGQRITAFVVGELDLAAAKRAVEEAGHPRSWAPKDIRHLDALPLAPTGKVLKSALRPESR